VAELSDFVPFCPKLGQVGTRPLLKTKGLALVPLVPLSHDLFAGSGPVIEAQRLSRIKNPMENAHRSTLEDAQAPVNSLADIARIVQDIMHSTTI
jgi:hypothetical protein